MYNDHNSLQLRFQRFIPVVVLSCLILSGCGGDPEDDIPKGSVKGTVMVNGEPFSAGAIRLTSVESVSSAFGAEMKAGGEFEIAEPIPAGSYKASISPPSVGPVAGEGGGMPRPATAAEIQHNIPEKYLSPDASDKIVEVKEGENTLAIELTP